MTLKETPYQNSGLTFLKAKQTISEVPSPRMGIVGIPFDGAVSFRPGARHGPDALRQASLFLTDGAHPRFKVDPAAHLSDFGDIIVGTDISTSLDAISSFYGRRLYNTAAFPLFAMGGDHLVTLGILRGMRDGHPEYTPNLRLIIFDAHCDTWEDNFGLPVGHGTWVRNVIDEGIVKPQNILQIAVRSPVDPDIGRWLRDRGGQVVSRRTASQHPETFIQSFSRERAPLYVSIDIDALDPAYAPGTGTPEIGGLTTSDMLEILQHHVTYDRLIGGDVVEVSPAYDHSNITALAGATMLWSMMSAYLKAKL